MLLSVSVLYCGDHLSRFKKATALKLCFLFVRISIEDPLAEAWQVLSFIRFSNPNVSIKSSILVYPAVVVQLLISLKIITLS